MKKLAATLAATATVGATLVSSASAMHARPGAFHGGRYHRVPSVRMRVSREVVHPKPAMHAHRWSHRFVA